MPSAPWQPDAAHGSVMEDARLRVVVIGAGIVGVSCALFLQRDGHHVTLLDPRSPGGGTSFGNAGVLSLSSLRPVASRSLLRRLPALLRDPNGPLALRWRDLPALAPWLIRFALAAGPDRVLAGTAALGSLLDRADRAHDVVIQQAGLADLVRGGGWLKVARDQATLDAYLAPDLALFERHGRRLRFLNGAALRALEPALGPEAAAGVLFEDNRAVRDPEAYAQGIARTVIERGGRHRLEPALGLLTAAGRLTGVATPSGPLACDAVVLAAGAFSRELARQAGLHLPLQAERGYHLMLPHPAPTLTRPVYSLEGGFVLAPQLGGLRLTGGVELARRDAPADDRRVRRLLPIARRLVPGLGDTITSTWQGHRPSLPDSLPVIGPAPGLPGLWLAFGHQHVGLTLGPLTGRLIADLVAGRPPEVDLTPFTADRF